MRETPSKAAPPAPAPAPGRSRVRDALGVLRRLWSGSPRARELGDDPVGRAGEKAAAAFLARAGYRILAKNARLKFGEGDLIALAPDERTIVLVEVKARVYAPGEPADIRPEASITTAKRTKLRAIARSLRRANRWDRRPMRIDSVGVELREGSKPVIRHTLNAVTWDE